MTELITIALLVAGTFASEDLTCITAGQLIGRGQMHWLVGVGGCVMGIYLGDLGLWLVGRIAGRRLLRWPWLARTIRLNDSRLRLWTERFDRRAAAAMVAARFLPGLRLPLYLAAGALGRGAAPFALWTFIAAVLWTPAVVLLVAFAGERFMPHLERFLGGGWIALAAAILACLVLLRLLGTLCTPIGRAALWARVSRIWRWEFWPPWLFYLPLVPWIGWLALRHRGFATITAANPGIPHGGFVGESKFAILRRLRSPHVIPTVLLEARDPSSRLAQLDRAMHAIGINFPIILKPDVGQRGAGVKLARTRQAAREVIEHTRDIDLLVQPFHPGPHEAGIFYYRLPGHARGRIFSITDKHFPHVTGDGSSTLRQLIWRHPRLRMQARIFEARHADQLERVPAPGECFGLALAGNHCQGTLFRDGSHLLTPEVERAIDRIARTFDGFYFGRFDVRYSDVEAFKAGWDLSIIELNGITSESTNIYDPAGSLLGAYRTLFSQWSLLFRIAESNRRRGHPPSRLLDLLRDALRHFIRARAPALSD